MGRVVWSSRMFGQQISEAKVRSRTKGLGCRGQYHTTAARIVGRWRAWRATAVLAHRPLSCGSEVLGSRLDKVASGGRRTAADVTVQCLPGNACSRWVLLQYGYAPVSRSAACPSVNSRR